MKPFIRFIKATALLCSLGAVAWGTDSITTIHKQHALAADVPGTADSTAIPDTYASFSVLQKKYLKTAIITNLLYAAGLGLNWGVVYPQLQKAEEPMEQLKVMPLSLLSTLMMYASLPMSVVTTRRAQKNYQYYYKSAPRNFTFPLLFTGVGLYMGASAVNIWRVIADYRDNHEFDQSYKKYLNLMNNLADAGSLTWAVTNLYSLVYIIVLGKKAEKHTTATSFQIVPFSNGGANGCMLTCEF